MYRVFACFHLRGFEKKKGFSRTRRPKESDGRQFSLFGDAFASVCVSAYVFIPIPSEERRPLEKKLTPASAIFSPSARFLVKLREFEQL